MKPMLVVAISLLAAGLAAPAQENAPLSKAPLNAEQLAVYHFVLAESLGADMIHVNLAARTTLYGIDGASGGASCGKNLQLESAPTLIHTFSSADLASLGGDAVTLVDPAQGSKDVQANDPERSMGKGKSIDEAVRNAFAHGLFTLSEIRFDRTHTHAIVSYSFVCGGLCGHGGTLILEKTSTGWRRSGQCTDWIS